MVKERPALGQKDHQPLPFELTLRNEVFARINSTAQELISRKEPLSPQDIFIPFIRKTLYDTETEIVLKKCGLGDGFSVIFVKDKECSLGENEIYVQGFEAIPSESWSSQKTRQRFLVRLDLQKLILGPLLYVDLQYMNIRVPRSVFLVGNSRYESESVPLGIAGASSQGNEMNSTEEGVLLLVGGKDKIRASSLILPANWRRAINKNGRLIEEPKEQPQSVMALEDRSPFSEEMSAMEVLIKKGEGERVFAQMLEKIKTFPSYKGLGLEKNGSKIASFGEAGTDVEIQTQDGKIVFNFSGFQRKELEAICKNNNFNLRGLASCFKGGASTDNLLLEVSLTDKKELKVSGKILTFDVGKNDWVDSLPYLGPALYPYYGEAIRNLLNNPSSILPFFFAKLKTPENNPLGVVVLPNRGGHNTFHQERHRLSHPRPHWLNVQAPLSSQQSGSLAEQNSRPTITRHEKTSEEIAKDKERYRKERAQKRNKKRKHEKK